MTAKSDETTKYPPLTITRTFDAPRDLVWQAWTEPEHFAKWWSPDGFTIPVCEMDVRPGGSIRIEMQSPDGTRYPSTGTVKEVIKPEHLSVLNAVLDGNGSTLFEVLQSVKLTEKGEKTELQIVSEVVSATPEAEPYLSGMEPGLSQALGKLERALRDM